MAPGLQGAIYLDSDLEAVRRCYLAHFPLPEDPLVLLKVGTHLLASREVVGWQAGEINPRGEAASGSKWSKWAVLQSTGSLLQSTGSLCLLLSHP